ncbi:MAG TPA: FxsA family protein [Geodermatophilus sp.]|nr:FxsA family protein [Geodermatophilus sp.]
MAHQVGAQQFGAQQFGAQQFGAHRARAPQFGGHRAGGRRVRLLVALWAVAEIAVFVLVAGWIGVGWTLLAALGTTVLGWTLLARQGTRALAELRERALTRQAPGRAAGDAGLVAVGGVLMVLPGFLGDLVGLLCLLPATRPVVRAAVRRGLVARLGVLGGAGPVRVPSARVPSARVPGTGMPGAAFPRPSGATRVIEGELAGEEHLTR